MIKKTAGILILFILILGMIACGNTTEDMTIGETEQILAEYLEANNPDIIVGGEGYAEYLSNLLTFEDDNKLAKEKYYENIKIYAAEYLADATVPENTITVQDANGETLTLLNDEIKAKTINEVKE